MTKISDGLKLESALVDLINLLDTKIPTGLIEAETMEQLKLAIRSHLVEALQETRKLTNSLLVRAQSRDVFEIVQHVQSLPRPACNGHYARFLAIYACGNCENEIEETRYPQARCECCHRFAWRVKTVLSVSGRDLGGQHVEVSIA